MAFRIFTRTWWRRNPAYPNGLEPHAGRKTFLSTGRIETAEEARRICALDFEQRYGPGEMGKRQYQATMKSHRGLRAEFEEV